MMQSSSTTRSNSPTSVIGKKMSDLDIEDHGSESESDEDEEEEEPKLKYERISGGLREILKKDGASYIAVNSKLLIVGTNWGRIHVLDHQGNQIRQYAPHTRPVTMIDMDINGDYIITCSHDRKVVVQGLYTTENCHSITLESPVRCVALDPNYGKARSGRRFIVGDHRITLSEKAMFGQRRSTVLSDNQGGGGTSVGGGGGGVIRGMKWGGQFLAWATDSNIKVMDMDTHTVISLIERSHSLALGCEQYPPHMCWKDERTLLIGWGDSVKVCRVRERSVSSQTTLLSPSVLDLPPYHVEIVYMFTTDFYVCGIGPLDKLVVVLAYNKNPTVQQTVMATTDDSPNSDGKQSISSGVASGSSSGPSGVAGSSSSGPSGVAGGSSSGPSGVAGGSSSGPSGVAGGSSSGPSGVAGGSSSGPSGVAGGSSSGPSGVAGGSSSALSGSSSGSSSGMEWRRPQMRVLDPLQGTYDEVSKDVLGIRCYQEYRPVNYHLGHLAEEQRFYIVCPQDVVVAKPRDVDDRVQWLLQHQKYPEALKLVEDNSSEVQQYNLLNVGREYLDHLMAVKEYQSAAKLCPKILGYDKRLWEETVLKFNSVRQLRVLSPHLPLGSPGPLLDPPVYQTVLLDLLHNDHQVFLQVVKEWSGSIYNVSLIINNVLEELARNTNNMTLLLALAYLYSNIDKHDKALAIYLKLKHTDVFNLISRHSLYGCVSKHVVELMTLQASTALSICSEHIKKIQPDTVVHVLRQHPQFLFQYLDMLYEDHRDMSNKYHNELIALYADYSPVKLMPLLKNSSAFHLKPALDVVKARKLNQETVYLLDRMGNSSEALKLVLEEEEDINWAMKLCEEHSDPDLWTSLIIHSLDKPVYIRALLNNMGAHVDPLLIIQCIPRGLQIPGLRDALTKIMHDYQLRYSLQSGYQKILVSDGTKLLNKQVYSQSSGLSVNYDSVCSVCNQSIIDARGAVSEECDLTLFYCHHVYHKRCVSKQPDGQEIVCQVCHNDAKKIMVFS